MKKPFLLLMFLCGILLTFSPSSWAVSMLIGDIDGFGFGGAAGYSGAYGGRADINGNGILDAGDVLPDLNRSGHVATRNGDDFDHRSRREKSASNGAQWTDISLSTSLFHERVVDDVFFNFDFDPLSADDAGYGMDHYVSFVFADYDVPDMYAIVDGIEIRLQKQRNRAGQDGLIGVATAVIPWEMMLDWSVTIDIVAPNEPYVAFDYAWLGETALPYQDDNGGTAPVPEPGTLILLGTGLLGLGGITRKIHKK